MLAIIKRRTYLDWTLQLSNKLQQGQATKTTKQRKQLKQLKIRMILGSRAAVASGAYQYVLYKFFTI